MKHQHVEGIRRPVLILLLAYSLAWWPLLALGKGVFWDDWTVYKVPFASILRTSSLLGRPWEAPIYQFLNIVPGLFGSLVFAALGIATVLLFHILRRTPGSTEPLALLSALVVCAAPLYLPRFGWVQFPPILAFVLFLAAWLIGLNFVRRPATGTAIGFFFALISALVLYGSFRVLALGMLLHFFWVWSLSPEKSDWKRLIFLGAAAGTGTAISHFGLNLFFAPQEDYSGYYEVRLSVELVLLMTIVVSSAFLFFFIVKKVPSPELPRQTSFAALTLGALLSVAAFVPYAAIGRFPPFTGWATRYEISFLLGLGFIAFGLLLALEGLWSKRQWFVTLVIALFLGSVTSFCGLSFLQETIKKQDLITLLSQESSRLDGRFVVFVDKAEEFNSVLAGRWVHYEWSGITSVATKQRTSFADWARDSAHASERREKYLDGGYQSHLNANYNFHWEEHDFPSAGVLIEVNSNEFGCGILRVIDDRICVSLDIKDL